MELCLLSNMVGLMIIRPHGQSGGCVTWSERLLPVPVFIFYRSAYVELCMHACFHAGVGVWQWSDGMHDEMF